MCSPCAGSHPNSNTYGYAYPNSNTNGYAYPNTNGYGDTITCRDPNSNT
jgi:hypothetical protein